MQWGVGLGWPESSWSCSIPGELGSVWFGYGGQGQADPGFI